MKTFNKIIFVTVVLCAVFLTACDKEEDVLFGSVYGIVTNTMSGEPIANASVMLQPIGKTTVTGSDGSFTYYDLEAEYYTVQVSANGFRTNTKSILVQPAVISRCDVPMISGQTEIEVLPKVLDYGTAAVRKTFTIYNNGSTPLAWQVQYKCPWIFEISPKSSTIASGGNTLVTVIVDRTKLTQDSDMASIALTTNAGDGMSVTAMIQKSSGSGGTGTDDPLPPSMTVLNGLAAYYTFEGNFDNTVAADPGAVGINTPKYVTEGGRDGTTSISFNRVDNSYINILESLIDGTNMSVSFWLKGIANGHLFSVTTNRIFGNNKSFVLYMENNQLKYSAYYYFLGSTTNVAAFQHPEFNSTDWNMITLTSDYGVTTNSTVTAKLYINGQFVSLANQHIVYTDLDFNKGQTLQFGGLISYGSYGDYTIGALSMQLDNLRAYNSRVLSASEVKEIYNAEK